MNCNLRVQAGPEIKGEVTSPSWENREKFAASRERCFLTEDTPQKHGYIISSYELTSKQYAAKSLQKLQRGINLQIFGAL